MGLNQRIISPLTIFSGSLSAHTFPTTLPTGAPLLITGSVLPTFATSPWRTRYLNNSFTTTSTTQQDVTGLTIRLENSKTYLILGYLRASTIRSANGFRIGVTLANITMNVYNIEIPSSTTAVTLGLNQTCLAGSGGGNSLANYYFCPIRALVRTAALLTPSFTPNISSEGAAGGATDVTMGDGSVLYYREY
jgi:hypothetical protein